MEAIMESNSHEALFADMFTDEGLEKVSDDLFHADMEGLNAYMQSLEASFSDYE